jgi:hypothetical protein
MSELRNDKVYLPYHTVFPVVNGAIQRGRHQIMHGSLFWRPDELRVSSKARSAVYQKKFASIGLSGRLASQ